MGLELKYDNGQTPLDLDEKEGLLIPSISTQGELDEFEQLNIEKAVEWTIHSKLKTKNILTETFIKRLHKKMYGEVWSWAGTFRKSNKNIGCDWPVIPTQLKALLDDTLFWIEKNTYVPDEIAIRFKHRIVSIHCFPNGNGRHSRLMADIIIESISNLKNFSWNQSNLIKADEVRKKYIKALKDADKGNITELIQFARN